MIGNCAGRRLDGRPSPFRKHRLFDGGADERASPPRSAQRVNLCDQLVVELYVQSHVLKLVHNPPALGSRAAAAHGHRGEDRVRS